ncbi:hypothetical protein ACJ51O_36250 (plasmid) [Burkholderia pyrrocinia]|uniref:hypothetical protein n=1 Tax=Burkholderia pyrrocinia TaxID=60550 RepID=UPI0038B43520
MNRATVKQSDPSELADRITEIVKASDAPWPGLDNKYFDALSNEMMQRYKLRIWDDLFKVELGYIAAIAALPPISDPHDPEWARLIATIEETVGRKDAIRDFFAGLSTYCLEIKDRTNTLIEEVAYYVSLVERKTPIVIQFGDIFGAMLSGIALIPYVGGALSGILRGIVSIAIDAMGNGGIADPFEAKFRATLEKYREQVENQFNQLAKAHVDVLNRVVGNYGKLTDVTDLINSYQVAWPQNIPDLFTEPAMRGAEVAVWQGLLPGRWKLIDYNRFFMNGNREEVVAMFNNVPWAYMASWDDAIEWATKGGWVTARVLGNETPALEHLARESVHRLFDILKVNRDSLFNGKDGWSLTRLPPTAAENPVREIFGD